MPHTPQKEQHTLQHLGISVEVGHIKNSDKNPVPERAVLELEEELLRHEPGGGPVTELGLAIATAHLTPDSAAKGCHQGSFGHSTTSSPKSRYLSMTYNTL